MNSSSKVRVAPGTPDTVRPTLGHECAAVLFLRSLIAQKDETLVAEIITKAEGVPEAATLELSRQGLISEQNEAVVAEFIKRTVRRFG